MTTPDFCVAAALVPRATGRAVRRVFTQALARYSSPEELLTVNGKVVTHRLTGVRCPTTTGKIERFPKTYGPSW